MLTYGGPQLLVLFVVFIVTPIIYMAFLKRLSLCKRLAVIAMLWVATVLVGYWDVFWISREARRLCREEAGLHIYKTLETDRVLAFPDEIENWLKHGFKYVESVEYIGNTRREQKIRLSLNNGEIVKERIEKLSIPYEIESKDDRTKPYFVKTIKTIKNIKTGELLGNEIAFSVYPGWLDSRFLGLLGFTWIPPRCDGDYRPERGKQTIPIHALIKAVIKPLSVNPGVQP